ncbi:MAG: NERD domain-containing protein [Cellulomonas sp.]|nr:NERD domain-containing protein [Cellulomonas sp.]
MLTVRRWRRYGADRLYVVAPTGEPMGSVDLTSGQVDVLDVEDEDTVRRAAQEYLRADVPELAVPRQRSSSDGLSPADEDLLAAWLGEVGSTSAPRTRREWTTRARLERLGDTGWTVLHDVLIGLQGSTCEHVAIGPPGAFTIVERGRSEQVVRQDGGTLLIDGEPTSVLRDVDLQARRVQRLLRDAGSIQVDVRAVVGVGRLDPQSRTRPGGALVVPRGELPGMLHALPAVLSSAEVAAVARAAQRATTWLPPMRRLPG